MTHKQQRTCPVAAILLPSVCCLAKFCCRCRSLCLSLPRIDKTWWPLHSTTPSFRPSLPLCTTHL